MKEKLAQIETQALADIAGAVDLKALEAIRVQIVGRKGALTEVLRNLGQVAPEERPVLGQAANQAKQRLSEALDERKKALEAEASGTGAAKGAADLSLPGRRPRQGHMHPINQVTEEIVGIFVELGFTFATGPEIETEYYNFDALNTPADHPSRDLHDTFFVKPGVVLRTQTSPVQIRVMEQTKPPVAVVAPGRVYRVDSDASHSPMFFQIEGLLVDEGVTFADLKGSLQYFVHRFFGRDRKVRFRPHYFPFTEPSAELDISCSICAGSGCRACKNSGWMELLGCGMVHPSLFRRVDYDAEKYTGYAFGFGIDRIVMQRHAIDTINHLYENDLRFLEQF